MKFLDDLFQLLAGEVDSVPVCSISTDMASAIGAKTSYVLLSSQTVFKQRKTHPDLRALDYLTLPTHFEDGLVLLEKGDRLRLHFCYQRPNEDFRYVATIKSADHGRRIYIVRFHRIRSRQTKSLMKRCTVLRTHRI